MDDKRLHQLTAFAVANSADEMAVLLHELADWYKERGERTRNMLGDGVHTQGAHSICYEEVTESATELDSVALSDKVEDLIDSWTARSED